MDSTERMRAEQALDAVESKDDLRSLEWPSVAGRIRNARSKAGFNESEIARRLGASVDSYCDLETYDDEAFTVSTLRNLVTLGRILSVEPKLLLFGAEADRIDRTVTFGDIAQHLAQRMADRGLTVEQLGSEIGFDVERLLVSPEALWDYTVEGLYAICKSLELDWVAVLPDTDPLQGSGKG